jgi:murein DD-endopeptidase MepM/ murein hydrolase activator NlpD
MNAFKAKKGKAAKRSLALTLPFFCNRNSFFFLFFFAFLIAVFYPYPLPAQSSPPLPLISRMDSRDAVFRQYMQDVEAARRILFSSRQRTLEDIVSSLTIYAYIPGDDESLMAIAARSNIPYGTLASINRFSNVEDLVGGQVILLPSIPGIFVPENPETDLERLLFSARIDESHNLGVILSIPREATTERFLFIPGDDFSNTERIYFLNRGFRFPLREFRITSFYGPRVNPVTGTHGIHRGIDLAAPEGTEVYAVRSGTVVDMGEDAILGKYIIMSHDNNWVSLYGHLSVIETTLRAELRSGSLIGRVGSTGQSTGPHLHFELRRNGQSVDPARMFGISRGNPGR